FARREVAARHFTDAGERAEPVLRAALERPLSAEARQRIEALLGQIQRIPEGEELRAVRAVRVLERVGTPATRELLAALAGGAAGARSTREARAARDRLGR